MRLFSFFVWSYSSMKIYIWSKWFLGKDFVLKFLGIKGLRMDAKWGFFCMNLQRHKGLKFVWENLCFEVFVPRLGLSSFVKTQCIKLFHKVFILKSTQMFFWGKSCTEVFQQKLTQNKFFELNFSDFFPWHSGVFGTKRPQSFLKIRFYR